LKGETGFDGGPGGDAPQGVTVTIDTTITGTFEMQIGGGFGHRTRSKKHMKFIHSTAIIAVATLAFLTGSVRAEDHKIPIRVVVVTTFQSGADNDPTGGEFGNWVLNLPLPITISFPQGYHHLRYNPDLQVLGMETGEFKAHAAASIMGLGMDPRFDLTKAYWIVAGIAGVDPNKASVASTAWAKFVVDGDLAYQIDAREIPSDWSTGFVPFGRSSPYQPPTPPAESLMGHQVYQLNGGLVDWAFQQTANVLIPDDTNLQRVRVGYPTYPNALKPPFVLEGDSAASDAFWSGDLFNTWAENWVSYWTRGQATFVMADGEDSAVGQALQFLTQAGKADQNRLLVLRSASNYNVQPQGKTPAQFLFDENNGGFSGFLESLNSVYQVGSVVVKELSTNWDTYRDQIPSPGH
jgi:purine nucleoside permease